MKHARFVLFCGILLVALGLILITVCADLGKVTGDPTVQPLQVAIWRMGLCLACAGSIVCILLFAIRVGGRLKQFLLQRGAPRQYAPTTDDTVT